MIRRQAFTLVELLVVVGVIALLVGMLLPVLGRARAASVDAACKSNLRQLYVAQIFYASEHRGRVAGVLMRADSLWPDLLEKYLVKQAGSSGGGSDVVSRVWHCPAMGAELPADVPQRRLMSYGVNACVNLPGWDARLDRRLPMTDLVLMADKALTYDDWLTSDDGMYLGSPAADGGFWIHSLGHRSDCTYRHGSTRGAVTSGGSRYANAAFCDGHVATVTPKDLLASSGHWTGVAAPSDVVEINLGACCGANGGKPPH